MLDKSTRNGVTENLRADVDYRLARFNTIQGFRNGSLLQDEICDAQPMLRRNAFYCGRQSGEDCPICGKDELVNVDYVFGPRLPAHGRCLSSPGELVRLKARVGIYVLYTIEVCVACAWNHLVRIIPVSGA